MQQCIHCGQTECRCGANRYAEVTVTPSSKPDLAGITRLVWGTDTNNDFFYDFEADDVTRFSFHIPKEVFYRDLPAKYNLKDPYELCHALHMQLAHLLEGAPDMAGAYALLVCLDRGELPADWVRRQRISYGTPRPDFRF